MGRIYTVSFENVSVTAAQDFFELTPADDKPIKIIGITLTQISDVGDAAEEMLRTEIVRGHTSSGSGGGSFTAVPADAIDTAAGFAAEINNTTIASSGTGAVVWAEAFNIRTGLDRWFPPGCEPRCSQAQTTIVVRLMAAPADAVTMSGSLVVEEG